MRANWFTDVQVATSDPFVTAEDLFTNLVGLVEEEAVLADGGLTCPLKDPDWAHPGCSGCPEHGSREPLCRVGLAEENTVAQLAAQTNAH